MRWRICVKPRCSSASTTSSRSNSRMPLCARMTDSHVRTGAERLRHEVKIATRPPGVSTRVDRVECPHRVGEQVQRGEAADGVEALVAEGQACASPRT